MKALVSMFAWLFFVSAAAKIFGITSPILTVPNAGDAPNAINFMVWCFNVFGGFFQMVFFQAGDMGAIVGYGSLFVGLATLIKLYGMARSGANV